jgi:hypothetical protein
MEAVTGERDTDDDDDSSDDPILKGRSSHQQRDLTSSADSATLLSLAGKTCFTDAIAPYSKDVHIAVLGIVMFHIQGHFR